LTEACPIQNFLINQKGVFGEEVLRKLTVHLRRRDVAGMNASQNSFLGFERPDPGH
jgi:hypothetical protein